MVSCIVRKRKGEKGIKDMILLGDGKLVTILETLEQLSSTNDKIDLLKNHKGNKDLRAFLDIALNPYRVYHIKKLPKKPSKSNALNQAALKDIYSLGGLVKYLENKKGLCGEDLDVVYFYFKELHAPLYVKWAEKALLKKAIGVGVKIVNKAFEERFIPECNVMLMSEWKEPLDKLNYPIYVQRKYDGFRCIYTPNVGFIGRSGKPLANRNIPLHFNMGSVVSTKGNVCNDLNCVFDGEAYSHQRDFNEIASILSSEDKQIPDDIKFYIFNIIPIEAWGKQVCTDSYTDQLQLFITLEYMLLGSKNITFMQTFVCKNARDLKELYQSFLAEGYEGAIARAINFCYCWKRATAKSQTIFKLKPKDHIDAKIIGGFEGQGNMTGMLGGLYIELENGIKLKVGSGFSEKERVEYWKEKDNLIEEWVRVSYTEKTPDGSLRFPVFNSLRDSKD